MTLYRPWRLRTRTHHSRASPKTHQWHTLEASFIARVSRLAPTQVEACTLRQAHAAGCRQVGRRVGVMSRLLALGINSLNLFFRPHPEFIAGKRMNRVHAYPRRAEAVNRRALGKKEKPPPPGSAEQVPAMRSFEAMMKVMISSMVENGNLQSMGNDIDTNIETVQKTVTGTTEKVQHMDVKVDDADETLTTIGERRIEMKGDLSHLNYEAIGQRRHRGYGVSLLSGRPRVRSSCGESAPRSSGPSRPSWPSGTRSSRTRRGSCSHSCAATPSASRLWPRTTDLPRSGQPG